MTRSLAGLMAVVVLAEILPFFWFAQSGEGFARLQAGSEVRRSSLMKERSADLLSFDNGVKYSSDRGGEVTLTVLSWDDGNSQGFIDAFAHSPAVCLPVSGASLLATFPTRTLVIGGESLNVECWMFSHPLFAKNVHAFKLARSGHPRLVELGLGQKFVEARLMLFREQRIMPSIEIAIGLVEGTNDPDLAWQWFARFAGGNFNLIDPSS